MGNHCSNCNETSPVFVKAGVLGARVLVCPPCARIMKSREIIITGLTRDEGLPIFHTCEYVDLVIAANTAGRVFSDAL